MQSRACSLEGKQKPSIQLYSIILYISPSNGGNTQKPFPKVSFWRSPEDAPENVNSVWFPTASAKRGNALYIVFRTYWSELKKAPSLRLLSC